MLSDAALLARAMTNRRGVQGSSQDKIKGSSKKLTSN